MSHYKFLSSIYSDATITAIIEEAINLGLKLTFIDQQTNFERALSKGELAAIRNEALHGRKAEIEIEAPSSRVISGSEWLSGFRETVSFGRRQNVGYSDLRADEGAFDQIRKMFGNGDKAQKQNSEINIASLSPKQIEERKTQISTLSLEKRASFIESRGDQVYSELEKKYGAKFKKKVVAELIRQEEKAIYESLGIELPPIGSYLKHTRKPAKKAEYSTQK